MKYLQRLFLGSLLLSNNTALSQDGTGVKYTIAVNMVGETKAAKKSVASDKFEPQEVEFIAYAPIDHLFDGTMSMAAHNENGKSFFEIHEATIGSSKIIPRSRFKVGQFFLGVGRLNKKHKHDWAFTSTPVVQKKFFGEEGVIDSGAEFATLLPVPFFLDLAVGVTNGFTYGHAHDAGEKPKTPTHYARLTTFVDKTQLGLNYVGRTSELDEKQELLGADIVFKDKQGKRVVYLLESEVWARTLKIADGKPEKSMGLWIFPQYGMTDQLLFGTRFDYFTVDSLKDAANQKIENYSSSIIPSLTWKPSEFSTIRLSYNHTVELLDEEKVINRTAQLQTVFMLGAHPVHEF